MNEHVPSDDENRNDQGRSRFSRPAHGGTFLRKTRMNNGFWQDEQIEYDVATYVRPHHVHSWRIEIEVVPLEYLDSPTKSRGFTMEQRVFAYCDCRAVLNEKEIVEVLNRTNGLDE